MDKQLRLLESFTAQGSDGVAYKVRAYEHWAAVAPHGGDAETWEPTGQAEYKLADGGAHIHVDARGVMTIAASNVKLRRI